MTDPRAVLKRGGLAPKKGFGQNFLVAPGVVERIAQACVPDEERGKTNVVELGAGTGALTHALAARAASVVAVERDRELVPLLREELATYGDRVRVVEGDAQTVDPRALIEAPRVLCGNLPYQITGSLLERAVGFADDLARVVFMVQLEVADRLAAEPGTKAYGALTVFVRAAFAPKKLFTVSPGSFHPPPEVTSAVVRLEPHRVTAETPTFRALVKGAFGARRKTLRNAWSAVAPKEAIAAAAEIAGVSLDARGETLSVDAFAAMACALDGVNAER